MLNQKIKDWLASEKVRNTITHPNSLTISRIAAIPLLVALMMLDGRFYVFVSAIVFSAASITDYFDGYLARRWGMVSDFGKVMDPLADKLLVSSALVMLVGHGWVPAWIVCVIIGREMAVTGLRSMMAGSGKDLSASWLGKYKTGFQIAAIIPLMIHYSYFGINFHVIGMFFLWGALLFTMWSGGDYFYKNRNLLKY